MATLPILGTAAAATTGTAATISPKGTLARLGLRTPSEENVITGKRIPGSASNKFLQMLGKETEKDRQKIINEAERKSSRKKGLGFVFKLLLKTLEDMKEIETLGDYIDPREWEGLMGKLRILKKKEDRLLYIIAYTSVLTDEEHTDQEMRDLLSSIKRVFHLHRHARMVTDWRKLYRGAMYDHLYNSRSGITRVFFDLDDKISAVKQYIKTVDDKSKTRDRRMARAVVKHKAPKNIDPSLTSYEGETEGPGPFANIGEFIPDTKEHKRKAIHEQGRVRGEKFRKEYYKMRRDAAIRRDIDMGRLTKEQAANLPEDYGRVLNAPPSEFARAAEGESKVETESKEQKDASSSGGRRRKRKTRKRRKKRTKKRGKSRNKKTNKKRRKRKTKRRR